VEREKKTQTLAMKVQASLLDRLNDIATDEDRPIGYVARELMLRGLKLYESDVGLREPSNTTPSANASDPAPVIARIEPAQRPPIADDDDDDEIRRRLEAELQPPESLRKTG
jgi:hypothetical protein